MPVSSFESALRFVDDLGGLNSIDSLETRLQALIEEYGFSSHIMTGILPSRSQKFEDLVLTSTLPAQFVPEYSSRDYLLIDPAVYTALEVSLPFEWCIDDRETRSEAEQHLNSLKRDLGMSRVTIFPLHGPRGFEACLGLVGENRFRSPVDAAALHLAAMYALVRARTLLDVVQPKQHGLTAREREVLIWIARGKSAWEIGEILTISKRTVDEHTQTAIQKLGAVNRAQAVAIALQNRLLSV